MLRGAIDYYDGLRVGGWIYSNVRPLRDEIVLAFLDDICVGAGKVEHLRQDLAAAGLGDGYCGFNFNISLPPGEEGVARVTIRLEGSDFLLMGRDGRIAGPESREGGAGRADKANYSIDSIEWMRRQNWLDQTAFDFLRRITTNGLYDRALRETSGTMIDAVREAKRLFELYRQEPVRVQEASIELRNLREERANLVKGAVIPVIAIHAPSGGVRLLEGPRDEKEPVDLAGAKRHDCRADRLLFIDTRAIFNGDTSETARVFRAV